MNVTAPVWLTSALAVSLGVAAQSQTATFNQPDFDRWNYPFNGSPGTRSAAPTFAAVGSPAFDDRDGQFLLGFDTRTQLPGLEAGQRYQIDAVTVTATHSTGSFIYDPTYDGFQTQLAAEDDRFLADADAGRPIVLTGAGLRGGFTGFGFDALTDPASAYNESDAFGANGPTPGPDAGDRNAFAAAFDSSGDLIDVSNNVRNGFDFNPFAVGTTDLNPGEAVTEAQAGVSPGSTFTFEFDLADAAVLRYVQQGVDDGGLFFSITSLHGATQAGGSNPNFYTRDSFDPASVAAGLVIDFTVVPEPTSLVLLGVVSPAVLLRRRRAHV